MLSRAACWYCWGSSLFLVCGAPGRLRATRGDHHSRHEFEAATAYARLGVTMKNLSLASMAQPMAAPVVYAQPMAARMKGYPPQGGTSFRRHDVSYSL